MVTTSYLTCDGCGVRFELAVQRSAMGTMPAELRELVYAFLLQAAQAFGWRDQHCPRCK